MNDVRKMIFGAFLGLFVFVGLMIGIVYVSSCGLTFTCHKAAAIVNRTPIPTLIPAQLLVATKFVQPTQPAITLTPLAALTPETETALPHANPDVARPSNPGGAGPALELTGNIENGKQLFVANCQICHGEEGKGGYPNPGTVDGTIPGLNPIDPTLVDPDYKTFAFNIDLFIEHGSTPEGTIPDRYMPAWGDRGALTPQEIADVIAYIISLNK